LQGEQRRGPSGPWRPKLSQAAVCAAAAGGGTCGTGSGCCATPAYLHRWRYYSSTTTHCRIARASLIVVVVLLLLLLVLVLRRALLFNGNTLASTHARRLQQHKDCENPIPTSVQFRQKTKLKTKSKMKSFWSFLIARNEGEKTESIIARFLYLVLKA